MTSSGTRRPVLVLVLCVLVAVALTVVGVAAGRGDRAGDDGWQRRLQGIGRTARLRMTDLQVAGGRCLLAEASVDVLGGCSLEVAAAGGPFPGLGATRRALLTAGSSPVRVAVLVAGRSMEQDLDPGGTVRLTFGPEGGMLTLSCAAGASRCSASLSQEGR